MKVFAVSLVALLLAGCNLPDHVDPDSPTSYCKRVAGQATMIATLRDQGTSKETLVGVLAVDTMAERDKTLINTLLEKAYTTDVKDPTLFSTQIELTCHQESWTPKKSSDVYPAVMVF